MAPFTADARRRLEEHVAVLKRSSAKPGTDVGGEPPRDLVETLAALQRIEKGTYGRCESCGGAIGRQRLLALPATRYCMACAANAYKPGP